MTHAYMDAHKQAPPQIHTQIQYSAHAHTFLSVGCSLAISPSKLGTTVMALFKKRFMSSLVQLTFTSTPSHSHHSPPSIP